MKKIICVFCFLLLANIVNAVVINEFTVDPQQDWDGSSIISSSDEWFELYNTGSSAADLTGWRVLLKDTTNETHLLSGTLAAGSYLVILNPAGQQNNDGSLVLVDNSNNIIDSVAYGSWNDGTISDNAADGNADSISNECLARSPNGIDTAIDSADFIKTSCTKGYSNDIGIGNSNNITIIATISNALPVIEGIAIVDEDTGKGGIQIYPLPGQNKTVAITATITDTDGYGDIVAVAADVRGGRNMLNLSSIVDSDTAVYTGNFEMHYYDSPANYTIELTAQDAVDSDVMTEKFEYLPLIGLETDTDAIEFSGLVLGNTSYIYGDNNPLTAGRPTVKNIGNVVIDAEVYGSDLVRGGSILSIDNLQYRFGSRAYSALTTEPRINDISLSPAAALNLDLSLYTPIDTEKGSYTGSLILTAVS